MQNHKNDRDDMGLEGEFPVDIATDGVFVVNLDQEIISFSEAAERITGFSHHDVVGLHCYDIFRTEICDKGCPVKDTLKTGDIHSNLNIRIATADDDRIPICASVSPLKAIKGDIVGAVVTFRNITEMKYLMEQLTQRNNEILFEKNKLEAIVNSIADGVFTIDQDWRITSFNKSAEQITGYKREEVMGLWCGDVFKSEICHKGCPLKRTLVTGEPTYDTQCEILTCENKKIPVSVNTALLYDNQGAAIGAVETFRDLSKIRQLSEELEGRYKFASIIGKSNRMQGLYDLLGTVAATDSTVLIEGESGTGKELVARAIHYNGLRRDKPFIGVSCAALPETLLESELLGHEKGAFTGAIREKPGRLELADTGTLFLDEVAELNEAVQAKLLRVLDQQEFERVGGTRTIKVDVRVIAATNRKLRQEVEKGKFREDLFYRLNVVSIVLPSLRERSDDIPLLVDHFIRLFNNKTGKQIRGVSQNAVDMLIDYKWPGNVRELENAIEHAFVHCKGNLILAEHLPESLQSKQPFGLTSQMLGQERPLEEGEKQVLIKVLEETQGNRKQAARRLGISRPTLWRKMKKYSLLQF